MTQPRVVLCSMWRNDEDRRLVDRVEHLLLKAESWPNLRWVWVVGDSRDSTPATLAALTAGYEEQVRIVEINTGIEGEDARSRLRRLSLTANEYFRWVDGADYILIHESDIISPYDMVPRMVGLAEQGICPVAPWPVIYRNGARLLYDIWAFRAKGHRFQALPPYHAVYRPNVPFGVDSFGTCFLMHAEDAPLITMRERAVLDLCEQLRQAGRTLWVDPRVIVEQPVELWQHRNVMEHL